MASAEPKLTEKKKDEDGFGKTEANGSKRKGIVKTEANGNRKKKNEDIDLCLRFARDYR